MVTVMRDKKSVKLRMSSLKHVGKRDSAMLFAPRAMLPELNRKNQMI